MLFLEYVDVIWLALETVISSLCSITYIFKPRFWKSDWMSAVILSAICVRIEVLVSALASVPYVLLRSGRILGHSRHLGFCSIIRGWKLGSEIASDGPSWHILVPVVSHTRCCCRRLSWWSWYIAVRGLRGHLGSLCVFACFFFSILNLVLCNG